MLTVCEVQTHMFCRVHITVFYNAIFLVFYAKFTLHGWDEVISGWVVFYVRAGHQPPNLKKNENPMKTYVQMFIYISVFVF